jgi:anti-sigma factor RsiW
MRSLFERHPNRDLVRYLDGELSARRTQKVAIHLESCGSCRAELDELQNTFAACTRYRTELAAQMPEAPAPWRDLYRDFSRIDEALANNSLLVRLMRPLVHSGVARWAFVTGLAALIVLLSLNQLRQAPSVQAATLLRKAVAVSQSQPRVAHRIRVRSSRQAEFTSVAGAPAAVIEVAQMQAIAALFAAAHWDWSDPLSARAFVAWRDRQVHKTDEVTEVKNPQTPSEHLTQIRTVSADGELEAASIVLDTGDYAAVSERLEFRDRDWVELSEIAETSTESAGGSGAEPAGAPVRAAEPPSRPAALAPGSTASISDELQVLSALNTIEADLGELEDISIEGGKVVVTGPGSIPPQRQGEIRASVANLPHVDVEFTSLPPVSVPSTMAAASGSATGGAVSPLAARIEKHLGGHAEFDRFSTQLLDLDDAAMQRVYALRRLAQKFPPEDEGRLSSQDLNVLRELSRKHTAVLAEKIGGMERILVPTLSSLGGTAASVPATGSHAAWQSGAEDVYRSARRVEVLISQMLGATPGNAATNALPSDLMTALQDLRANLDDCRKTLK